MNEPEIEYDPKPWDEMTSEEKKAHMAKLRAEMPPTTRDTGDAETLLQMLEEMEKQNPTPRGSRR